MRTRTSARGDDQLRRTHRHAVTRGHPKVIEYITRKGLGRAQTNYKLKDWLISRQRYWGCPIPIIHCAKYGPSGGSGEGSARRVAAGEGPRPEGPLAAGRQRRVHEDARARSAAVRRSATRTPWTPSCVRAGTSTGTSIRRMQREPWSKDEAQKWLPVDIYIGGAEHACMHLLYFRFIAKVLFDAGWVPSDEPVVRLYHQGMVCDEAGDIMSKSKGNAVSPGRHHGPVGRGRLPPGDVLFRAVQHRHQVEGGWTRRRAATGDAAVEPVRGAVAEGAGCVGEGRGLQAAAPAGASDA